MIQVKNIRVWGFDHAIRGMRNPMNSWNLSDSYTYTKNPIKFKLLKLMKRIPKSAKYTKKLPYKKNQMVEPYIVGPNDLDLMKRLFTASAKGNHAHRKYLRQISISLDINAPLYWWKQFDTYKIGTTTNSCSTMHKIHDKEFQIDDFSHEHLSYAGRVSLKKTIITLNKARHFYLNTSGSDKQDCWWDMIQLLPSSYNQKRTITMNYENAVAMIVQRDGHKLDEWNNLVKILKQLPYMKEIMNQK